MRILFALMGVALSVALILGLCLYLPAFLRISSRRRAALNLFSAVPRGVAASIFLQLSNSQVSLLGKKRRGGIDTDLERELDGLRNRRPALTRLSISYVVCICMITMLVLGMIIAAAVSLSELRSRGFVFFASCTFAFSGMFLPPACVLSFFLSPVSFLNALHVLDAFFGMFFSPAYVLSFFLISCEFPQCVLSFYFMHSLQRSQQVNYCLSRRGEAFKLLTAVQETVENLYGDRQAEANRAISVADGLDEIHEGFKMGRVR